MRAAEPQIRVYKNVEQGFDLTFPIALKLREEQGRRRVILESADKSFRLEITIERMSAEKHTQRSNRIRADEQPGESLSLGHFHGTLHSASSGSQTHLTYRLANEYRVGAVAELIAVVRIATSESKVVAERRASAEKIIASVLLDNH